MGIFKKEPDATQPLTPDETQAVDEVVKEQKDADDRSEYNCGNCEGEGLIFDVPSNKHVLCTACNGTGKVN